MTREKLINEIIRLQHQLMYAMEKNDSMAWMELNLTIAQLKSLIFIYFEETTNFVRLANALGVTPPNVTGIINRLVEQELVTREENHEDRRTFILQATEKGKALVNRLHERGIDRMAVILNRLSIEELTGLASGLAALVKITGEYREKIQYECD
jgi:DNA-binding MarR family transcriptional regulator